MIRSTGVLASVKVASAANMAPVVVPQCSAAATANASFDAKWWKKAPLVTPAWSHSCSTVVACRP